MRSSWHDQPRDYLVLVSLLLVTLLAPPPAWAQTPGGPPVGDLSWLQMLIGVAGAPVVMALVSALVKPFVQDPRWYPPAAIVLGIGLNLLLAEILGLPMLVAIVYGLLSGLAAAGLYSGAKTVLSTS